MTEVAQAARGVAQKVCDQVEAEIEQESRFPITSVGLSLVYATWLYRAVTPENESDRTGAWFQTLAHVPPLVATLLYLATCYFGNKYMANRKPFDMKQPMLVYNLYQTIFNIFCIVLFVKEWRANNMSVWGNRTDYGPKGFGMAQVIYLHYNNKYIELLDTMFMMLRKKTDQMSFLHKYHHVLLIWAWHLTVSLDPGGDAYFGAAVNTFVHVVMYSYYFFAALGIGCPWKRYITKMQLSQFVICGLNSIYCAYVGNHHPVLPYVELWVMVSMFYLFSDFYRQAYKSKKKST